MGRLPSRVGKYTLSICLLYFVFTKDSAKRSRSTVGRTLDTQSRPEVINSEILVQQQQFGEASQQQQQFRQALNKSNTNSNRAKMDQQQQFFQQLHYIRLKNCLPIEPIAIAIVGKSCQQQQQFTNQQKSCLNNSNSNSNRAQKGNSNSSFNTIDHLWKLPLYCAVFLS